jgi:hypothetical protein
MVHELGRRLLDEVPRYLAAKGLKVNTNRRRDNHQPANLRGDNRGAARTAD